MKVILYMAISIDGYIAKKDGDSDWVSEVDAKIFEEKIEEAGCIVVGRKTFDQYYDDLYPVKGVTNIVLTSDEERQDEDENVVFVSSTLEALQIAKDKKHEAVFLIGGGLTNTAFVQDNLVDEIFLSVHPVILGEGIKIFENFEKLVDIEFIDLKKLNEGLIQLHYKIIK
jgi:dihydrofolate reductase